ncbi:uncharacterized protein B0H18DRAFT_280211 [Fomitopsis serialis]|uniref:uncharacterized protein n=1 Tax=Fomitopsis serialis TaxID=139415 RepID=UPI002008E2B9|nr:uncharacterized protein B0H18DRAFT_280211 [Neoantrodia serialis]KAH9927590.1 hypothetical protein B0H18DRAFT_280211 [Neoantrodia serialis]
MRHLQCLLYLYFGTIIACLLLQLHSHRAGSPHHTRNGQSILHRSHERPTTSTIVHTCLRQCSSSSLGAICSRPPRHKISPNAPLCSSIYMSGRNAITYPSTRHDTPTTN